MHPDSLMIGKMARCRIVTPEGVVLSFEVATIGDRAAAFLLDILLIAIATIVIAILAILASFEGELTVAFAMVAAFLLRNFYFSFSELWWSGATIGKRRLGLRVIARDGGPLTAEMIFARNLTRDLEFFLPLTALLAPEALISQGRGWGVVVGLTWLFIFALLPLFGRYRLRCGDLIAGTVVVREPKAALLADIAMERTREEKKKEEEEDQAAPEYTFTTQQLDLYGIHELQVLEDLFRRHREGQVGSKELLKAVSKKIMKKIAWPSSQKNVDTLRFLEAFYRAQRARLEHKLLFGDRKERKSDRQLGSS